MIKLKLNEIEHVWKTSTFWQRDFSFEFEVSHVIYQIYIRLPKRNWFYPKISAFMKHSCWLHPHNDHSHKKRISHVRESKNRILTLGRSNLANREILATVTWGFNGKIWETYLRNGGYVPLPHFLESTSHDFPSFLPWQNLNLHPPFEPVKSLSSLTSSRAPEAPEAMDSPPLMVSFDVQR